MKNILVIGMSDNIGGVETYFHNYYQHMDLKKYHFDFVTVCNSIAFDDEYRKNGSKIFKLPNFTRHPVAYYNKMRKIMHNGKYDVVHINMLSAANILPVNIAKKSGIKRIIVHSHNSGVPKGFLRRLLHSINKRHLSKLDLIRVACSNKAGEWLFGREVNNFIVLNNAIDLKKFSFNRYNRNSIRKKYGVSDDEILLGNVGRLCEQKNQIFLIKMMPDLDRKYKLLLIGDGEDKESLMAFSKKKKVDDRIIFVNNTEQIKKYYSAMDVLLMPSKFEGMPVVAVEAQANGLSCIFSEKITREAGVIGAKFLPLKLDLWVNEIKNIARSDRMVEEKYFKNFDIKKKAVDFERVCGVEDDTKITIIVPAFNVEKYIDRCLFSLVNQTYGNIEVIIVDDFSTDNTCKIIEKFLCDKRVKFIKMKENSGANVARGVGVKKATGKYCMFVDADDWLELDSVEKLMKYEKMFEPDIIRFDAILEPISKKRSFGRLKFNNYLMLNNDDAVSLLFYSPMLHELAFNFYKTSLLKNCKFFNEKISFCEDYFINVDVVPKARRYLFVKDALYHYERGNSSSSTMSRDMNISERNFSDTILVNEKVYLTLIQFGFVNNYAMALVCILENYMWALYGLVFSAENETDKKKVEKNIDLLLESDTLKNMRDLVPRRELSVAMKKRGLKFNIAHRKMIMAILYGDAGDVLKYAMRYKMLKKRWV